MTQRVDLSALDALPLREQIAVHLQAFKFGGTVEDAIKSGWTGVPSPTSARIWQMADTILALTALEARGLAVVPVVATEGMQFAGRDHLRAMFPGQVFTSSDARLFYAAMLSASKDDPNV